MNAEQTGYTYALADWGYTSKLSTEITRAKRVGLLLVSWVSVYGRSDAVTTTLPNPASPSSCMPTTRPPRTLCCAKRVV